jgi:hypothetical protein
VVLGDVVDELLDQHRLADTGAAEESGLAALRIRLQQVDDLDAGLEHLDLCRLLLEGRRRTMDWVRPRGMDGRALVDGLADDVQDPPERLFALHGQGDGCAGVQHAHAAREAVGRSHGHRAHPRLAEVLRDLERELLRIREDVLVLDALHEQRVVDGRQLAGFELDVDDGSDDLDDSSRAHTSAPWSFSPVAPCCASYSARSSHRFTTRGDRCRSQ